MAGLIEEREKAVKDWNFAFWVSVGALIVSCFFVWQWRNLKDELHALKINRDRLQIKIAQTSQTSQKSQDQSDLVALIARKDAYIGVLQSKVDKYKSALTPAQLAKLEKQSPVASP